MKSSIIFLLIVSALVFSCVETKTSEMLYEEAEVVDVIYTPSQHDSNVSMGFTTSGDVSLTPVSVDLPTTYAIVFRCSHGKFVIQGTTDKYKQYWENFREGQIVTISYKEVYEISDNEARLVKYDFIDAK